MNKRTALSLAVSMAISYPISLHALGLGELHSSSHLNQQLNAQIDLLSTTAQEAGQLQVRLASPDVFSRVGIDRPAYLNSLKFSPAMQNGKPIIRVSSDQPITEPFLNFLLEVSWPQGQLLKEYTVLLDPPVLMQAGTAGTENAAAVRAEPKSAGVVNRGQEAERQRQLAQQERQRQLEIQRQQQAQAGSQAARELADQRAFEAQAQAVINEPAPAAARASTANKYRVKRGDTMSRVASRLRYRGVSNNQMMVALFRANPHAFAKNNINYLKSGALLTRPAKSEVVSQSSAESRRIVRQHHAQWKKYRAGLAVNTVAQTAAPQADSAPTTTPTGAGTNQANLKVAGSDSESVASNQVSAAGIEEQRKQLTLAQEALASSNSENAELRSRVTKLEAIIRKKDRLITLKEERLAKLEAQLAGATTAGAEAVTDTETPTVNESTDLAQQVGNEAEQNQNRIIRGQEEAAPEQQAAVATPEMPDSTSQELTTAVEDTEAEGLSDTSSPFVDDEADKKSGGILDLLTSPLVAAIGGGSLLALFLGWLLMRRSSSSTEPEDAVDEEFEVTENFDDELESMDSTISSLDEDLDTFSEDDPFESSDATVAPFASEDMKDEGEDAIDSILTGDDTIEEDEILQEADVYIVYGLHEQAEEELKKAISDNPSKLEYRYKLLENYKAAGDSEKFIATAKDYLNTEGDNKQKLWDKITVWGKEVAPENEMFAESSAQDAAGMLAGAAGLGAAANVAKEAFADDDLAADLDSDMAEMGLDSNDNGDLEITGLDSEDFDLDLDDDFGLDELANEMDDSDFEASSNVLSFETPASSESNEELANVSLEIDQDTGLDKILPTGNAYTDNESTSSDEGLDDALSFLDLSDDEEMQEAHIGTKLDLARAYLDMGDVEGARCTLEEVVIEGNEDQKREAEELLQQTG